MESEALIEISQINDEFTLLALFVRADIVVKLVILILFVASLLSWTIIIHKIRLFKKQKIILRTVIHFKLHWMRSMFKIVNFFKL